MPKCSHVMLYLVAFYDLFPKQIYYDFCMILRSTKIFLIRVVSFKSIQFY